MEAMELLLKAKANIETPDKNGGNLSLWGENFGNGGDGLRRGRGDDGGICWKVLQFSTVCMIVLGAGRQIVSLGLWSNVTS